jgi:hypothetical protein
MKHILTTLIFLFISFNSFSINDTTIQIEDKKKNIAPLTQSENNTTVDAENYYRLLYENSKSETEKYVNLLTTALTVIIALIIAIVGSSFFYNYRFNKKEFELITNETADKIKEVQNELIRQTKEEIEILTKENKERINEEFGKISDTYKTNFDTLKESIKTILMSFKQDIDKRLETHDKTLEELEAAISTLEETAKEDLKLNEKSLKIDLLDIKGELYVMKGWNSLALSSFVDQANLCVETNNKWRLEFIVGDIISSINKVIEKDDTITTATKLNIEKLIPEIPPSLSDKKKSIEENYKKIKIKDHEPYRRFGLSGFSGLFGT